MTLKELNEIPFSVKTGKLSLKEGKNQVWVFIKNRTFLDWKKWTKILSASF